MNTAAPVHLGNRLAAFEKFDAQLVGWAREWQATEAQFPSLIDRDTLNRAEYAAAFPHLLMSACRCADPARPLASLLAAENLVPSDWLLSPAVCYHAYGLWSGSRFQAPRVLTARGRCFRHEETLSPGRRQVEFEMREIVLAGPPDWIERRTADARHRIEMLGGQVGLSGEWEVASDPFFLPSSTGRAYMQRLQETKMEFIVRNPEPLAIASINRHGAFFGERFDIKDDNGIPVHTACIAFGLDRWVHSLGRNSQLEIYRRIRQSLPHLAPAPALTATFAECGGDSVDWVDVCCLVESDYGLRLSVDDLSAASTLGELLELVDRQAVKRPGALITELCAK